MWYGIDVAPAPLREPGLRSAIQALQFPTGSRGLDAGCGIGLQALLLAEEVEPARQVTVLDLSPELLAYAEDLVENAGLSERIAFREGDVNQLRFDDDTFDWACSVDLVGCALVEALPLVKELARVVKPGGSVAILALSSEKLLPGHPLLEARLRATTLAGGWLVA
ncbi:class I SAM-dependent methyltransferase [Chloroflexota bacterium]